MNIFQYQESDQEKINSFQKLHITEPIPLYKPDHPCSSTYYLEGEDTVRGIVSLRRNEFHPVFHRLFFCVDKNHLFSIQVLYDEILKREGLCSDKIELFFSDEDAEHFESFINRNDFSIIVQTDCPEINIDKSLKQIKEKDLPDGFHVKEYSELNEDDLILLQKFRMKGYEKTHFWTPPLDIESELWDETMPNSKEKEISYVIMNNGKVLLCSDGHFFRKSILLGWGWHDDDIDKEILEILWSKVLCRQLMYCKEKQYTLLGEFDSTDHYAQYKRSLLCEIPREKYFIYHHCES